MREIKFRGKRIDTNEWIYGDLVTGYSEKTYFIAYDAGAFINTEYQQDRLTTYEFFEVIPETIGQYTGLKDKNGQEIFEGDILRTAKGYIQMVLWVDYYSAFVAEIASGDRPYLIDSSDEVIGNIHDNPELLERSKDEK